MIITYALQYYDKGVYNQASLFGFLTDLDLSVVVSKGPPPVVSTLRYSQASMIFYCGYLAGVYPSTLIAQKYRTGRICGIFVFLWGVCEICTVACHSFAGIMVQRFFLGVLEGGIGPVFAIVCSQFYKRDEMALRVGLWFSAQPLSNTFAPLISYGFGSIKGPLAGYLLPLPFHVNELMGVDGRISISSLVRVPLPGESLSTFSSPTIPRERPFSTTDNDTWLSNESRRTMPVS